MHEQPPDVAVKEVQSCGVYLVSDRFDCAAKMIVRRNSVGTGGVLFPGTAMVKKRHITSFFLPNDCGQARRGEAPELSVPLGSALSFFDSFFEIEKVCGKPRESCDPGGILPDRHRAVVKRIQIPASRLIGARFQLSHRFRRTRANKLTGNPT